MVKPKLCTSCTASGTRDLSLPASWGWGPELPTRTLFAVKQDISEICEERVILYVLSVFPELHSPMSSMCASPSCKASDQLPWSQWGQWRWLGHSEPGHKIFLEKVFPRLKFDLPVLRGSCGSWWEHILLWVAGLACKEPKRPSHHKKQNNLKIIQVLLIQPVQL